ncbi:GNAT family N-acetyltransferase [Oceanimonas doudoroffii]|uniref:GNAT family N-acetyltransferase n=1 Tax=Oceanimonas doudoroffii TaxID=84158 RepID=A0A233RGB6_9GAMM|nr:GNAT family N-acetyltransferase [Oceanimonas doudoroffii]OXY82425.1 GNAT family N-acetyltransferase [Oceanimonas doudoroffii]
MQPQQPVITLAPIASHQDTAIAQIIRTVGAEFGAVGEGFGPGDAEVQCMSRHYTAERNSRYLVAEMNGRVVGGAGLAPLGNDSKICELKKLFLLPEARGHGIGRRLAEACLDFARERGFSSCYLDTLSSMTDAIGLYERLGFRHLDQPLLASEHGGCDVWMLKAL